ncbi:Uncharacterised protein [Serratia liquefaciens]|nr:Uncharacterised protein [Serratia liquefaciens]
MRFTFKNNAITTHVADTNIINNVIISTFSKSYYSTFFLFHSSTFILSSK